MRSTSAILFKPCYSCNTGVEETIWTLQTRVGFNVLLLVAVAVMFWGEVSRVYKRGNVDQLEAGHVNLKDSTHRPSASNGPPVLQVRKCKRALPPLPSLEARQYQRGYAYRPFKEGEVTPGEMIYTMMKCNAPLHTIRRLTSIYHMPAEAGDWVLAHYMHNRSFMSGVGSIAESPKSQAPQVKPGKALKAPVRSSVDNAMMGLEALIAQTRTRVNTRSVYLSRLEDLVPSTPRVPNNTPISSPHASSLMTGEYSQKTRARFLVFEDVD